MYHPHLLTLEGGHSPSPFWCLCQKFSLSLLHFNKTLLHKSSEWSSLVTGSRLNSSPLEAKNPGVFCDLVTTFQDHGHMGTTCCMVTTDFLHAVEPHASLPTENPANSSSVEPQAPLPAGYPILLTTQLSCCISLVAEPRVVNTWAGKVEDDVRSLGDRRHSLFTAAMQTYLTPKPPPGMSYSISKR